MSLVPRYSLLEPQRINRPPLSNWASEILDTIRTLRHQGPAGYVRIATCMNFAALVEMSRGNLGAAEGLCNDQLGWIANTLRDHDDQSLYEFALQPWVNLGRLLRITGQVPASLDRFSLVLDCDADRAVTLGPVHISSQIWGEMRERKPEVRFFLATVYVIDSLKTFFSVGRYDAALEFIERSRGGFPKYLQPYFSEAEVVALAGQARYGSAQEIASSASWGEGAYAQMVSLLYQAALSAVAGDFESACPSAAKSGTLALATGIGADGDPKVLRYLEHLGALNEHLKSYGVAAALYKNGYHAALRLRDQPYQLSFLDAMMRLPKCRDFEQLELERSDLLRDCLYVSAVGNRRSAADLALGQASPFDDLVAEIRRLGRGLN